MNEWKIRNWIVEFFAEFLNSTVTIMRIVTSWIYRKLSYDEQNKQTNKKLFYAYMCFLPANIILLFILCSYSWHNHVRMTFLGCQGARIETRRTSQYKNLCVEWMNVCRHYIYCRVSSTQRAHKGAVVSFTFQLRSDATNPSFLMLVKQKHAI